MSPRPEPPLVDDLLQGIGLRIRDLAIAEFALPLRQPWRSARGARERRRGWLIRLRSTDGLSGYGESAPLPGAGTETREQASAALRDLPGTLARRRIAVVSDVLDALEATPSVRCALETALLDLIARYRGRSVSVLLNTDSSRRVRVNAAVGATDSGLDPRAREAVERGYRVLKLKLGVYPSEHELEQVHALARSLDPGIRLRLDANGGWDEVDALRAMESLADLPIDGLEEPVGTATPETWRRLQACAPWPLAIDESLHRWPIERLLEDPPARRIVLKPMAIGGPLATLRLAARAHEAGIETVVTTSVDSAVGTWAALQAAAALGDEQTHGLATSDWLAEDVGAAPGIERGLMSIGSAVGLGVVPCNSILFEEAMHV
jgi:o-succinylbenzoate synthase